MYTGITEKKKKKKKKSYSIQNSPIMEVTLFLMGGLGAPEHLRKINAGHVQTHSLLI
jgi:hypothetical protein